MIYEEIDTRIGELHKKINSEQDKKDRQQNYARIKTIKDSRLRPRLKLSMYNKNIASIIPNLREKQSNSKLNEILSESNEEGDPLSSRIKGNDSQIYHDFIESYAENGIISELNAKLNNLERKILNLEVREKSTKKEIVKQINPKA